MKKNSYFVIYKSFENLSLNNFQVIFFERIAKKCFKVNILSKICWNLLFSIKKNNNNVSNNINKRVIKTVFKYFLLYPDAYITSATYWQNIIYKKMSLEIVL